MVILFWRQSTALSKCGNKPADSENFDTRKRGGKIIQKIITISAFIVFAILLLKERLAWNYLVAFAFLGVAAFFAFAFKAPAPLV
ncbi:MAG: DMT family protein [Steroidobacteraceae bacterium]